MQNFKDLLIVKNDGISGKEVGELRRSVGWDSLSEKYAEVLKGACSHFSIRKDSELVAFVRIVSDGLLYAFIVDLVVHPSFQNQGLGKHLIQHVIESLKQEKIRLIQLTFDPELEAFYTSCGFKIIKAGSIKNW